MGLVHNTAGCHPLCLCDLLSLLARPHTRHRCSRRLLSLVMSWCKRYGWLRRPTHSKCDAVGWGGAERGSHQQRTRACLHGFFPVSGQLNATAFPLHPPCAHTHRHLKSGKMRRTDGELADVLPWLAEQAQDWEAAAAAGAPAQPPLLPDTRCACWRAPAAKA